MVLIYACATSQIKEANRLLSKSVFPFPNNRYATMEKLSFQNHMRLLEYENQCEKNECEQKGDIHPLLFFHA